MRGLSRSAIPDPVPLSRVLKILNKPVLPVPHPLFRLFLDQAWKYGLSSFPAPELDHIRFNCVLDTRRAEQAFDTKPERTLHEILEPFRVDNSREALD